MRRVVGIFLVVATLMGLFSYALPQRAEAASVRNRKIVSVVYDDSTSMEGEKWEYTSYAMQCFAAMLNKEDRLDITYMSSYEYGSYSVDTGKMAESVKEIREHPIGGGTPAAAINTAYETLISANDSNENTQYWLIIMTDGQMNGAEDIVNEVAEKQMPNGTKPHIIYLTLCDMYDQFTPVFNKPNIENRAAKTADEIIDVISDIACDISGRFPADPADIRVIDDTTVEIVCNLPLINMGILSQRSKAQVVSVADKENNSLKNEGNVPVAAPGRYAYYLPEGAMEALNGNVALFSADSGNIPAGTYVITFTEPVDKEDLVIMLEPAFELRLELSVGGTVITDPTQLGEGTVVDVEAALYEMGTDNKISLSMLPSGYQTSISYAENGKVIAEDSSLKLTGLQLKTVETEVNATLEIPGFFTATDLIRFTPQAVLLSGMDAEVHYDGSQRMVDETGKPDPNDVVYIDRLDTNETGIAFRLEIDGQVISKDQALSMQDLFEERLSAEFPNYDVTVANDGRLIVTPRKTWWVTVTGDLVYSWLCGGEKSVSCTYDGITASANLTFKLADRRAAIIGLVIRIGILAGIVYVILWIFAKHHFKRPGKVRMYRAYGRGNTYAHVAGTTKRIHWLTASDPLNFFGLLGMRVRIRNTKFRVRSTAGDGYRVEGVKNMIVSTGIRYPSASNSRCQDSYKEFTSVVYIFDGVDTYYKIAVE